MRTAVLALAVLSPLIAFGAHGQGAAKKASAQDYPNRALRAIVASVPGGGSDISSRIVAAGLGDALGKQIVVDNRPGGGGTLGVAIAAKALPDGYTVLMGSIATHGINPALFKNLPYHPIRDFAPVSMLGTKRNAQLPDVPTVIESGIPGYEVTIWYGMFVPAAVPKPIIARLNAELVKVLNTPELKTRLGQSGIDAVSSTPEELAAFVKAEVAKWTKVVKIAGVQPES